MTPAERETLEKLERSHTAPHQQVLRAKVLLMAADGTIAGWTITPLEVRDADPEALEFEALGPCNTPCFRRGQFDRAAHEGAVYLDVSGWGMGEVWINGHYLGSFWDEEKQQSILIPAEILAEKGNRIVVFDLKNNDPGATMRLSDKPVFK